MKEGNVPNRQAEENNKKDTKKWLSIQQRAIWMILNS